MSDHYILDENNAAVPVDLMTWAHWLEDGGRDRRIVARTTRDDITVSTVFLGLDHSFGEGPPVLWETMIFGGPHDEWQERYTSHEDALAGHAAACELAFAPAPLSPAPHHA